MLKRSLQRRIIYRSGEPVKSIANNLRRLIKDQRMRLKPLSYLVSSLTLSLSITSQFSAVVSWADIKECDLP